MLYAYKDGIGVTRGPTPAAAMVVYPTYRSYEVALDVPEGVDRLDAMIFVSEVSGECLLVDDVSVTRD